MNNKNIIIAGVIAIGLYILSQPKKIYATTAQKVAQRIRPAAPSAIRQRTAQKIAQRIAQKVAERVPERRPVLPAIPVPKKIAQKKVVRTGTALKIYNLKKAIAAAQALRLSTMAPGAVLPPLVAKAIQDRIVKAAIQKAAVRKAAAQKIGKKIGKTVAQKIKTRRAVMAQHAKRIGPQIQRPNTNKKRVASWKAPYKFPKSKFRVITPTGRLKNLIKKAIVQKKAVQQKKVQKTTPGTPSVRRKSRLEALYGSHWHDIWVQRQKR